MQHESRWKLNVTTFIHYQDSGDGMDKEVMGRALYASEALTFSPSAPIVHCDRGQALKHQSDFHLQQEAKYC